MNAKKIGDIKNLGSSIREKIDRRALRWLFDDSITHASLTDGMERIESEILVPMERFIRLVREYK